MTLCRSRGEIGRARHRPVLSAAEGHEEFQCRLSCSGRRSLFSQPFALATLFAGRPEAQTHCLALESSPLDRPRA